MNLKKSKQYDLKRTFCFYYLWTGLLMGLMSSEIKCELAPLELTKTYQGTH